MGHSPPAETRAPTAREPSPAAEIPDARPSSAAAVPQPMPEPRPAGDVHDGSEDVETGPEPKEERPERTPLTPARAREALVAGLKHHKWEVLVVAFLTAAAAVPRMYALTEWPPGIHGDEAWTGLEATRILREGSIGTWSPSALWQPAGPFYWTALVFRFLEPGLFSLRFSVALLGTMTVPAVYLFAREVVGRRAATIGAILVAVSFWHIHYSRIAFTLNALPLLSAIALYLMVKGLKERRTWMLVVAGATASSTVYVYGGFVALFLTVVFFWVYVAVRRQYGGEEMRRVTLALLIPAVIVAVPFLQRLYWTPNDIFSYGRLSYTSTHPEYRDADDLADRARFVLGRLARGVTVYSTAGKLDSSDGMGLRALLDPLAFVLLAVGVVMSLRRWREWPRFLLLAALLGGVLVTAYLALPSWAESRRGIAALPAIFALAGLGGDTLLVMARRWTPSPLAYAALGVVLAVVAYTNVSYYFGTLARSQETRWVFVEELTRASTYLNALPEDDLYVYFYSGRWSYRYETRRFLAPDVLGEDRSREHGKFSLDRDPSHVRVVYILLGPYRDLLGGLRAMHPNGSYYEETDGDRFVFGAFRPDGKDAVPASRRSPS